jgi:hypothetical protein
MVRRFSVRSSELCTDDSRSRMESLYDDVLCALIRHLDISTATSLSMVSRSLKQQLERPILLRHLLEKRAGCPIETADPKGMYQRYRRAGLPMLYANKRADPVQGLSHRRDVVKVCSSDGLVVGLTVDGDCWVWSDGGCLLASLPDAFDVALYKYGCGAVVVLASEKTILLTDITCYRGRPITVSWQRAVHIKHRRRLVKKLLCIVSYRRCYVLRYTTEVGMVDMRFDASCERVAYVKGVYSTCHDLAYPIVSAANTKDVYSPGVQQLVVLTKNGLLMHRTRDGQWLYVDTDVISMNGMGNQVCYIKQPM